MVEELVENEEAEDAAAEGVTAADDDESCSRSRSRSRSFFFCLVVKSSASVLMSKTFNGGL